MCCHITLNLIPVSVLLFLNENLTGLVTNGSDRSTFIYLLQLKINIRQHLKKLNFLPNKPLKIVKNKDFV